MLLLLPGLQQTIRHTGGGNGRGGVLFLAWLQGPFRLFRCRRLAPLRLRSYGLIPRCSKRLLQRPVKGKATQGDIQQKQRKGRPQKRRAQPKPRFGRQPPGGKHLRRVVNDPAACQAGEIFEGLAAELPAYIILLGVGDHRAALQLPYLLPILYLLDTDGIGPLLIGRQAALIHAGLRFNQVRLRLGAVWQQGVCRRLNVVFRRDAGWQLIAHLRLGALHLDLQIALLAFIGQHMAISPVKKGTA